MNEACLELGLEVTWEWLEVLLTAWTEQASSSLLQMSRNEAFGSKTQACGGTKRRASSTPAGRRSRNASRLTLRQSIARCRGDRQGASLAFDALKSSQVRTGRHRTRCHVQHGFSSLQSGAKHHVLNTSDVTRLPRFPKRLVHVLASEFTKGSPFCLNPA